MRLYKFLPAEFAIQDIEKRHVKISTFPEMNDPFELLGTRLADPIILKILAPFIQKAFGVISFSRTWVDPVLWAHYAVQHRGICLVFDLNGWKATRTRYVRKKELYDTRPFMMKMAELMRTTGSNRDRLWRIAGGPALVMMNRILSTKFDSWAYEKESRIFTNLKEKKGSYYKTHLCDVATVR